MKTFAKIALFALAAASLAPAHAASPEQQLAQLRAKFKASDKNGDGKLTKAEAEKGGMTRVATYFGFIDSDGDGFVTLAQLEKQLAARRKER